MPPHSTGPQPSVHYNIGNQKPPKFRKNVTWRHKGRSWPRWQSATRKKAVADSKHLREGPSGTIIKVERLWSLLSTSIVKTYPRCCPLCLWELMIIGAKAQILQLLLLAAVSISIPARAANAVVNQERESDGASNKFTARDFMEFGVVKRRIHPELSLDEWRPVRGKMNQSILYFYNRWFAEGPRCLSVVYQFVLCVWPRWRAWESRERPDSISGVVATTFPLSWDTRSGPVGFKAVSKASTTFVAWVFQRIYGHICSIQEQYNIGIREGTLDRRNRSELDRRSSGGFRSRRNRLFSSIAWDTEGCGCEANLGGS